MTIRRNQIQVTRPDTGAVATIDRRRRRTSAAALRTMEQSVGVDRDLMWRGAEGIGSTETPRSTGLRSI
jgi:hypothetical protein